MIFGDSTRVIQSMHVVCQVRYAANCAVGWEGGRMDGRKEKQIDDVAVSATSMTLPSGMGVVGRALYPTVLPAFTDSPTCITSYIKL